MASKVSLSWGGSIRPVGAHNDSLDISSAVVLNVNNAEKILIQTLTQNIRYTLDGTTPTASVGFQLLSGDPPLLIILEDGIILTVIEESATADFQYQLGL